MTRNPNTEQPQPVDQPDVPPAAPQDPARPEPLPLPPDADQQPPAPVREPGRTPRAPAGDPPASEPTRLA